MSNHETSPGAEPEESPGRKLSLEKDIQLKTINCNFGKIEKNQKFVK